VLDRDPVKAATDQCDKHIVKMPLETAQMLCTVARANGYDAPYRSTHAKHPCTLWAGSSTESLAWLIEHGIALCDEYSRRYGREHKSKAVIEHVSRLRLKLSKESMPAFAQAMPESFKDADAVKAYRSFYREAKAGFAVWSHSTIPEWWS